MSEQVGPWKYAVAIVQSDSTVYNPPLRGLYVMAAGNVKVLTANGVTRTWACPAGFWIPDYISKVFDTDTAVADVNLHSGRDELLYTVP